MPSGGPSATIQPAHPAAVQRDSNHRADCDESPHLIGHDVVELFVEPGDVGTTRATSSDDGSTPGDARGSQPEGTPEVVELADHFPGEPGQ